MNDDAVGTDDKPLAFFRPKYSYTTQQLGTALAAMGAIKYTAPPSLDELRKFNLNGKSAIRGGISSTIYHSDDEEDLSD